MMTALSLEMDLERVENAPRKMFTPGIVPADLTLMEEEELKKERSKVREQIEATTVAIIAHKKDQQDLEKFIQVADAKREAAIKDFNEERQAYMMDLTGCLDKLQALRLEKSSIEERLEYVKYEMKRRILQEQAMETSSVCSAAGTERRIADRAVDDRPQRKEPAGDVPRPRAAGPGEVTVKARPPGPPAAAPDVGGSPAAAAAPILGGSPAAVAAPVLGGGVAAAAAEVIGGGYPRPPPPPPTGPSTFHWDTAAAAGSGGPAYVPGEVNSKASLPRHNMEQDRSLGRPDYTARGPGPVDRRSRSRERQGRQTPAAPAEQVQPQPPALTPEQVAIMDVGSQQEFWLSILADSTHGGVVNRAMLKEKFWARLGDREHELIPRVRIPWNQYSPTQVTHRLEGLNWAMTETAFMEKFGRFKDKRFSWGHSGIVAIKFVYREEDVNGSVLTKSDGVVFVTFIAEMSRWLARMRTFQ